MLALTLGCANHIRFADAVIWDRVPGTDRVSLDDQQIEGATVKAKVRFVCQRRQYAITNEYYTPYDVEHEIYEMPVGLVTLPFSFLWWIVGELMSLGSAPGESLAGPIHWSAAGLNPILNVEGGMFFERYSIREKQGSRRPQQGSTSEPYDAVLPPMNGTVEVKFEDGGTLTLPVGDEVLLIINLIEVARVMPAPDAQKILIDVALHWNPEAEPAVKTVSVFIDKDLASSLYELRDASHTLMTSDDPKAFNEALAEVEKAGFSREAAMIRDKRGR
jgi:hypothetical protein